MSRFGAMKKISWSVGLLLLLATGCSTTITNLTPSTQTRNANGLYPFEVAFDSNLRCIRNQTIQPYVLVGDQAYPMRQTPMLKDRWETLVPVPPNREYIDYQFKFNYECNNIAKPTPASKLSKPYQVKIIDK